MKRVIDVVTATFLLIILAIPMLLIALWIKLDSEGPVLFKQKRVGQYSRHFNIYKFRTMAVDTPNIATNDLDPTQFVTKCGRFLRRTSLDELPQLWNILKGDMAFIGPRPALYNQYELIAMRDKHDVHTVKPGLTGYAQVNGRDFISDELKVWFDRHYVSHRCLKLDFKIACKTVSNVLRKEGIR